MENNQNERIKCFSFKTKSDPVKELDISNVASTLEVGKTIWVDILTPSKDDVTWLSNTFSFHDLALSDILNDDVRPKQELYDEVLFTVFKAVNLNPGQEALDTINLNIFLSKKFIVTTHNMPLKTIDKILKRISTNKSILEKQTDNFYYALLDGVVDRYFDILDELEEELLFVEDKVFSNSLSDVQEDIFKIKKKIAYSKRSINPKRDALRSLVYEDFPQLSKEVQLHLRDVLDHVLRISESLDSQKELISGLMDSYMTQISNKMNEVMKLMSIIATIMLPLSFLTGLFGMNFENMPGLSYGVHGFWVLVVFMILLSALIILAFKRSKIL